MSPDRDETSGSESEPREPPRRRLYLVAHSHLDTQWRWTVREVIQRFLPRTVREVKRAFDRFPRYVQSFEGSFRYRLLEEFHPEAFAEVERWIDSGRLHPAGSMLESPDVLIPAPESLLRHILLGSRYFRQRLGRPTRDLFLPDCFGVPWSLPTIAAHCGLIGFSSSKHIKWGEPPFDVGVWEGPDGSELLAVLDPGGYGEPLEELPSRSAEWRNRIDRTGRRCGAYVGYRYFGVGDRGGAPDDRSLERLERAVDDREGEIEVVPAASDAFFVDEAIASQAGLPRHRGELLLRAHGTGCLTSQVGLKRWNRRNEERALAAEAAAVAADWLGATPYPSQRLRDSWTRFLWHQHHDDVTGTSIPAACDITWNDQVITANELDGILLDAVEGVSAGLDTRVDGTPLVVFNPLALPRQDLLELPLPAPTTDRAYGLVGPDGERLVTQWEPDPGRGGRLLCRPRLPALGFVVLDLIETDAELRHDDGPTVEGRCLVSERFRVSIDAKGRVESILDRALGRELLDAPVELELLPDRSRRWPAWELLWDDVSAEPVGRAGSAESIRTVESGPVRATVEIVRRLPRSRVTERVSISRGGDLVEWRAAIDWRERRRLLKVRFPLAASSPTATFDLGLGAIERGNASPEKYEVPAQRWVDLTDERGGLGVTILSESRLGWDKPDDRTLRLSLLRAPRARWRFRHQATQDHGRHRMGWALRGHRGSWNESDTVARAARFTRPPLAFRARAHPGALGRTFGFLSLDGDDGVLVQALKRAEDGDDLVLRVRETTGRRASRLAATFPRPLTSAERATGDERFPVESDLETTGEPDLTDGDLEDSVPPFGLATYRLRIEPPEVAVESLDWTPLAFPHDTPAASFHDDGGAVWFDRTGRSFPGELLPERIEIRGVPLELAPLRPGKPHCLACRSQLLELPDVGAAEKRWLVLLVASSHGHNLVELAYETATTSTSRAFLVPNWRSPLTRRRRREAEPEIRHRQQIAWVGTHRHDRRLRDEPYELCYLYAPRLAVPVGTTALRLPDDPHVHLFAATVVAADGRRLTPTSRNPPRLPTGEQAATPTP